MARLTALIMFSNPVVARKTASIAECGGMSAEITPTPRALAAALERRPPSTCVVLALGPQYDEVRDLVNKFNATVFPCLEEVDPQVFAKAALDSQIGGITGLRFPGAPPRTWELVSIARRFSLQEIIPPPHAPLAWGHEWYERYLGTTQERSDAVEEVRVYCERLQSRRQAVNMAQLTDELVMNAMYDAPVDEAGTARYAHRRKESISLRESEQPLLGYGSDGARVVIAVTDPFGRLTRASVFQGIDRGVTTGAIDTSGGGAGLGMMLVHQMAKVVFFDVLPNQLTQVTTVIELDVPPRLMRALPGSVHYFTHGSR